ncbi:hypothetical protein [Peribacillus muralis]
MLGLNELRWEEIEISSMSLKEIKPLFKRINLERIDEELERLNEGIL